MSYEVRFERAADRDLDRLPAEVQRRVIQRIQALADDPRPPGAEALGGPLRGLTKLRVGKYRISYEVSDEQGVVTIMEVGHRRDIYHGLSRGDKPRRRARPRSRARGPGCRRLHAE